MPTLPSDHHTNLTQNVGRQVVDSGLHLDSIIMDDSGCGLWREPQSCHVKDRVCKSLKRGGALQPLQKCIFVVHTHFSILCQYQCMESRFLCYHIPPSFCIIFIYCRLLWAYICMKYMPLNVEQLTNNQSDNNMTLLIVCGLGK